MTVDSTLQGARVICEGTAPVTTDLVFVHGLGGHPINTWSTSAPPSDTGKKFPSVIGQFFRRNKGSISSEKGSVFWPRDLLADDVPHSRIITFGYESNAHQLFSPANKNNILGHGRNMLAEIQRIRNKDPKRAVIFICHSIGGIITKQALKLSRDARYQPHLESLYRHTYGIIFLGTPHRGSTWAPWGAIAGNLSKLAFQSPNTSLIRTLQVDDVTLATLSDDFSKMIRDDIVVYSFGEERGMSGVYGLDGKIVDDFSSYIGDAAEGQEGIDANHRDMCKFSSQSDAGYRKVSAEVVRFVNAANQNKKTNRTKPRSNSETASAIWPRIMSSEARRKILQDRNLNHLNLDNGTVHLPILSPADLEVASNFDVPNTQLVGNSLFELLGVLGLLPGQRNSASLRTKETPLREVITDQRTYYSGIPRHGLLRLVCSRFHSIQGGKDELSVRTDIGTFKFVPGPRGLALNFVASERSVTHIAPAGQDFFLVQQAALGKFSLRENLYATCDLTEDYASDFPIGPPEWMQEKPREAITHITLDHLNCIRFLSQTDYTDLVWYLDFVNACLGESFAVLDQHLDCFTENTKIRLAHLMIQWESPEARDNLARHKVICQAFKEEAMDTVDNVALSTSQNLYGESTLTQAWSESTSSRTLHVPSNIREFAYQWAADRYDQSGTKSQDNTPEPQDDQSSVMVGAEAFRTELLRNEVYYQVIEVFTKLEEVYKSSSSRQSLQSVIRSLGDSKLKVLCVLVSWMSMIVVHGAIVKDASVVAPEEWMQLLNLVDSDILVS